MCFRRYFSTIFHGVLLSALLSLPAMAQIHLGPKAGIQYGWVNFDDERDDPDDKSDEDFLKSSPALGAHAGVTAIFQVKEQFFLDAELLYTLRQTVIKGKLDPQLKNTMFTHMIELPVTFRMNFNGHIGSLKYDYFLGAGPNVSYWLFSTGKLNSSEIEETNLPPIEYRTSFRAYADGDAPDRLYIEDPNRIQLGVNLVGGLYFKPSEGNAFKLDVRFDYGHSYFARTDYGIYPGVIDYSEPLQARYSALKIGVAYIFDTKVSERKKGKSTFNKKKR